MKHDISAQRERTSQHRRHRLHHVSLAVQFLFIVIRMHENEELLQDLRSIFQFKPQHAMSRFVSTDYNLQSN